MNLEFKLCTTPLELEEAWRIRRTVFSGEQSIPNAQDLDGKDEESFHILIWDAAIEKYIGTGRLTPQKSAAILARIAVLPAYRGRGIGKKLVQSLEQIAIEYGINHLILHPHKYLEGFYSSLGYIATPDPPYIVAGHELIVMEKMIPPK